LPFKTTNKDMQLTKAEFAKRLPRALDGYAWESTATGYCAMHEGRAIEIDVEEMEPRRIALIVLPRCSVSFRFDGFTEDEQRTFMNRFNRIFQKGGG